MLDESSKYVSTRAIRPRSSSTVVHQSQARAFRRAADVGLDRLIRGFLAGQGAKLKRVEPSAELPSELLSSIRHHSRDPGGGLRRPVHTGQTHADLDSRNHNPGSPNKKERDDSDGLERN